MTIIVQAKHFHEVIVIELFGESKLRAKESAPDGR